jgi:hypothetical protein
MKKIGILFVFILIIAFMGCNKNNSPTNPTQLYNVTAKVLDPTGQPIGGATLALLSPPTGTTGTFSANTDSLGNATIQSPAGAQTLIAYLGSIFRSQINVNVQASSTPTNVGSIKLQQNTTLKVLVVQARAEQLENVLRQIGFTTFDSTYIDTIRAHASIDSTAVLTNLKNYTLVFSDCNGGDEYQYPLLARIYGRYIQSGGKIYGGHYNYYNLQTIYPGYYTILTAPTNYSDSLKFIDANIISYIGYTSAYFNNIGYYNFFTDIPSASKIYATVANGTANGAGVIIENYLGTGEYLWTAYHNQDVINDPKLIKTVKYFLYSL